MATEPNDDGLGALRGLRSAIILAAGVAIIVALALAVGRNGHDETGRVRAAVNSAQNK